MVSLFSIVYAVISSAVQFCGSFEYQLYYYQRNLDKDQIGFSYNKVVFTYRFVM